MIGILHLLQDFGSLLAHVDADQVTDIVSAVDHSVAQHWGSPEFPGCFLPAEHVAPRDFLISGSVRFGNDQGLRTMPASGSHCRPSFRTPPRAGCSGRLFFSLIHGRHFIPRSALTAGIAASTMSSAPAAPPPRPHQSALRACAFARSRCACSCRMSDYMSAVGICAFALTGVVGLNLAIICQPRFRPRRVYRRRFLSWSSMMATTITRPCAACSQ
jgi:hypothetical protein